MAAELVGQGAEAVLLMGSHARGDAMAHSDVDLLAIGEGPEYVLQRRCGYLFAVSWTTVAAVERSFAEPASAGYAVQGWRDARILADRDGLAAGLQEAAREWAWQRVGDAACNRYVAGELTGLAEEVHKLANLHATGNLRGAAVQRNLLAIRLSVILGVHLRLLYSTENELWNMVAAQLDDRWRQAQDTAFGLSGEPFGATCGAALQLYGLAAELTLPLLDTRQHEVVRAACALDLS